MKKLFLLLCIFCLIGIAYPIQSATATPALQNQPVGVDVLFALDTTSSMFRSFESNDLADNSATIQNDESLTLLNTEGLLNTFSGNTDPERILFEAAQFNINWLKYLTDTQNDAGVEFTSYASVLTFNDTTDIIMPWTRLNEPEPDSDNQTTPDTTIDIPSRATDTGMNYIDLMQQINDMLASRPGDSENRIPLVFIISDSLPCIPGYSYTLTNGSLANENCTREDRTDFHLTEATAFKPADSNITLFFALPSDTNLVNFYQNVGNWNLIADSIEYPDGNGLLGIGDDIFSTILDNVNRVIPNYSTEQIRMNTGGSVQIPPYQSEAEIIVIPTDGDNNIPSYTFQVNGQIITPSAELNGQERFKRFRFENPPPGTWTIEATNGASVRTLTTYQSTLSNFALADPELAAIDAHNLVTVQYSIDGITNVESYSDSYPISVTASVQNEDDNFGLEMQPDGDRWIGSFVPRIGGEHIISINVEANGNWTNNLFGDDSFLTPANNEIMVDVTPISFTPEIMIISPSGTISTYEGDAEVVMTFAQAMNIMVSPSENLALDSRYSAILTFNGPIDDESNSTCLNNSESFDLSDETFSLEDLSFEENGTCSLGVQIIFDEPDLIGESIIYDNPNLVQLTVRETAQLAFNTRNTEGETLADGITIGEITFEDRVLDLSNLPDLFPYNSERIEIVMFDESDKPIFPAFAQGSSDEEVAQDTIPFTLSLLNADSEDISGELGIEIVRSDNQGVYTINITNLDPGEYTLTVSLQDITLDDAFQYQENFTPPTGSQISQTTTIIVEDYPYDSFALLLGSGFGIILLGVSSFTLIRRRITHSDPLNGFLVVYEESEDTEEPLPVWVHDFSKTNINDVVLDMAELPLWNPRIIYLRAKTRRRRDRSMEVSIKISDAQNEDAQVQIDTIRLYRDAENLSRVYDETSINRSYSIALKSSAPQEIQ